MQEQVNEKTVALSIKGAKLTGRLLAKAMRAFLQKAKQPGKTKQGKQSVRSLTKQGASLAEVEVEDINTFKKTARKYNIDFAVRRDDSVSPPNWIVFFKAKDSKALESAFKEYSSVMLKHKEHSKPSMLDKLQKFKELAKSLAAPVKNRDRGEREI